MNDDLIRLARKRFDEAHSAELEARREAEEDLRFVTGDPWDKEDRANREADGKPVLVVDGIATHVRQVTGQLRLMNPEAKVLPDDSRATQEVAEVIEGLVRHIQARCDAPSIYEGAAESAAACGIGNWRVRADYVPGETFQQELLIERIYNPFAVFWDPFAKHPTRCDARYVFIVSEMPKEQFETEYPGKATADVTSDNRMAGVEHWVSGESVVVAEYMWIEHEEIEIAQTPDGAILRGPFPPGVQFARKRKVREPRVKWAKINGVEVLEGPLDFPCRYLPVVACVGEEWHLGERSYRSSVVRHAKDAVRLYNFARSVEAEVVSMQPRAPYLLTTKQIEGLESHWSTANTARLPYLVYKPDERAGPPQRIPPPIPSSAIMAEIQLAAEDIKRTTGIYDASLGARSNETSGVAIRQRQMEAQNGTSAYADNMTKGVWQTARILVDMIPRVYDAERTIRILGPDDQEKQVVINRVMQSVMGQVVENDLTTGAYDVKVSVGPAYATRRQEASAGMLDFVSKVPLAAQVAPDLIAGVQDWPDADRIAGRLRKAVPQQLLDDEEGEQEQSPEAMQARQAQMQQAQAAAELQAREAMAKVAKAEADARKAQAEAQEAALKVAQMTGQIDAAIQARVQEVVGQMLIRQTQPAPGFPA